MEKISLITSICALIITILNIISMFNKGLENNDKTREDKYFSLLLVKYMNERHNASSVLDFIKKYNSDLYDNYIPPYIRVIYESDQDNINELLKNKSKESEQIKKEDLLHHALVIDYFNLYENDKKLIRNISRVTDKLMNFLYLLLAVYFLADTIVFFVFSVVEIIGKNYLGSVVLISVMLLFILFFVFIYRQIDFNSDMYSISKKYIKKKVASIEKEYNKINEKNYLS